MTDWRTIGDIEVGIWRRTLHEARSPLEQVATEAYQAATPHTALALAMLNQESSYGTAFRRNVAGNHNPLNLRPPDGDGYMRFSGWVDGVRAWRERITDPAYKGGIYAGARTISELVHVYAPSSDNNNEAAYVAGIESSLLRWGVAPKEQSLTKHETVIPGLPGGPLVTDYPISLTFLLPSSQTINRPGIKAKLPRVDVQHGNGNPNAFAASDAQWLRNGAKNDQGQPTQTSFHATADDNGVFICVPADEVTWQAADGAGPGNMSGFSCEMSEHAIYRQDMNRLRKNIYVNADFMGRVAARLNIAEPGQHWDYNYESEPEQRHNCPNILRTMSIEGVPCWTIYRNQWNVSKIQELADMTQSLFTKPLPITWKEGDYGWKQLNKAPVFALEAEVECVRATTPLAWADGDKSDGDIAPAAGPKVKQGERVKIIGSFAGKNSKGKTVRWLIRSGDNARLVGNSFRPLLPVTQ